MIKSFYRSYLMDEYREGQVDVTAFMGMGFLLTISMVGLTILLSVWYGAWSLCFLPLSFLTSMGMFPAISWALDTTLGIVEKWLK